MKATVALAAAALLAAACSGSGSIAINDAATPSPRPTPVADPGATPTPPPTPTPEPNPAGRADLPDDLALEVGERLAVQSADGQIFTVLPDGMNPVPLTNPDEGTVNSVATWSPDANRLSWVSTDPVSGDASVRAARFDGTAWSDIAVSRRPFYLSWDATGTRVASLAPVEGGFELGLIDLGDRPGYTSIDRGGPFWFSWSPDADGFLVHASVVRLDFVPLDGATQVLESNPASFQAPVWMDGPVPFVYADEQDGEQFLVVAGDEGKGRRAIASYDGYLQFVANADSGLIAMRVLDKSLAPVPQVITAGFQADEPYVDIIDPIAQDELVITAVFGGEPFVVWPAPLDFNPDPVMAFYWSPDGNALAWLVEIEAGDGDCASETSTLQWQFWDGSQFTDGPTFIPTPTYACEYLPFFDQFGQSHTYWSPDGTSVVYAGTDPLTELRGIFTTPIASFGTWIADGEHGVWSPTSAGSGVASSL